MTKPRAIIVCVDYHDLLQLTLPYNRHHFSEVWIVTSIQDEKTQRIVLKFDESVKLLITNLFYKERANFNKWGSLEWGLDQMKREGLICVMDADIVWPKEIPELDLKVGQLLSPYRRMAPLSDTIPDESTWLEYNRHRNVNEWAGYSQVFHGSDPVLVDRPWYREWKHAGGADSFFQQRWRRENKIRPDWECLHIGPAGTNWTGRATPYLDGSEPEKMRENRNAINRLVEHRAKNRGNYSEEIL